MSHHSLLSAVRAISFGLLLANQVGCLAARDLTAPTTGQPGANPDAQTFTSGAADAGLRTDDKADAGACLPGENACPGLGCVDSKSPEHCGGSCSPCPSIPGGTATCDGNKCGIACPTGMTACLDRCLAQGVPCEGSCPAMKRACNGICVDLTNLAACGTSCMPCPSSSGGKATCNGTSCELACDTGFHLCDGNTCRSDRDIHSCGSSCTPCPVPMGGEATCDGTVCGARCPANTKLCAGACIAVNQACMGMCPAGNHECSGNCVPNDVNFCGPACKQCKAPSNADAKCDGNDCQFACRAGFRQCGDACVGNDRPCNGGCPTGAKVCGDRCVPTATCCTSGMEGCPQCFMCGSDGTCGKQAEGAACGNDQVCRTGSCVPCGALGQVCCSGNRCGGQLSCQGTCKGECTPGQRECQGQTPRTCNQGGQWENGSPCNGQACVNGSCSGSCMPGQKQCQGQTAQTCGPNGTFISMPCTNQACVNGSCTGNCAPGQSRCQGQTAQTCNDKGTFDSKPCTNQACVNGSCQGNCSPSSGATCAGSTRTTCSATGMKTEETCTPKQANETASCASSGCQSSCKANPGNCSGSSRCWNLQFGCDECIDGRVFRNIPGAPGGGDRVCVGVDALNRVQQENADGPGLVDPARPPFCLVGFVFRDAFSGDQVCVTDASRSLAAEENRRHRNPNNAGEAVTRVKRNPNCATADVNCN
jgi:hypothetical protein